MWSHGLFISSALWAVASGFVLYAAGTLALSLAWKPLLVALIVWGIMAALTVLCAMKVEW